MKKEISKHCVLCLVLITILFAKLSLANASDTYVSDKYGNIVFTNGTVRYVRPVPVGNATYTMSLNYDAKGLELLYQFARSFVQDIQPDPFPFELLEQMTNGTFVVNDDYEKIIEHFYGLAACLVIGLVFVLFFLIGGCCFCCCRCCCGNCGGDEIQEFRYLVTDMYDVIHMALQKDIDNIGTIAEEHIFDSLRVRTVIADTLSLDAHLNSFSTLLTKSRAALSIAQLSTTALESALNQLADDIDETAQSCPFNCQPNLCNQVQGSDVRYGAISLAKLPDFDSKQTKTDEVRSQNKFTAIAVGTLGNLEEMSDTIDKYSTNIKSVVSLSLSTYRDLIHSLSDGIFQTMTTAFPAETLKRETTDIFTTVSFYDKYRRWVGFALTVVFIGLAVVFLAAVTLGVCGYSSSALPTERGCTSNCAGNLLLLGVVLLFIIGTFLLLLTIFVFLFGAMLEKSCEPLEDLTVFKNYLDTGKAPGYSFSEIALGITTLHLNTYGVLVGCRANKTPWVVLKLGEVVPLEEYIKYINYLGDIGQFVQDLQNVDIGNFSVLAYELGSGLTQVEDNILNEFNFTEIENIINQPLISFDMEATLISMNSIQNSCNDPTKSRWTGHIASLSSIDETEIADLDNAMIQLRESFREFKDSFYALSTLTSLVRQTARTADNQIQNNMTNVLLQASAGFVGRLFSILDSYASEVIYLIYNDLGNCLPLWNLYKSFTVVLCDYGVDTLNGYWFSVGWGLFFFPSIIVVATMLAKYYKTMEYAVGYTE